MNNLREETIKSAERILIKIGSAVLTDNNGLNSEKVRDISLQIYDLIREGKKTAIVSSGAVAAGKKRLPQHSANKTLPAKQALAAVGQSKLINCYETIFNNLGIEVAQILLTREGLSVRNRFLNAQNTLNTLLDWGVVPIINENDTVSAEELQFTDNDTLASLIVSLIDADLLIILSETDALYDKDPRDFPDAKKVSFVEKVDTHIMDMAGIKPGSAGRGGMKSKLLCARMVNASGVPLIIAGGNEKDVIRKIFSGDDIGTFFQAENRCRLHGKKPWIAFTLAKEGVLFIDDGAVNALIKDEKSLLPVGIKDIQGDFEKNACVLCCDLNGREIAIGITNYTSKELKKVAGKRSKEINESLGYEKQPEVIHRDNMVILEM